jgi:stearoyl-CoA desaturase (delta-9 desaturase)
LETRLSLTWNGRAFDWVNVGYFGAIHLVALAAPFYFSWQAAGVMLCLYWLSASVGICLGYHRLLTHRSLKVGKPVEYMLTILGMLASEGGAISWVSRHRYHHITSDRKGRDVHTPKDGFWWSHFGWILCDLDRPQREYSKTYASDLMEDPVHRVLERFHVLPNVVLGLALFMLGGWGFVVWGIFLRLVVVLHATWLVNSAAHTWGYRTYDTPDGSRNLWWVGLLAFGEGWHNNHHAFQRSARHGLTPREIDMTWWVIRALQASGLAWDVLPVPANSEKFRIPQAA